MKWDLLERYELNQERATSVMQMEFRWLRRMEWLTPFVSIVKGSAEVEEGENGEGSTVRRKQKVIGYF